MSIIRRDIIQILRDENDLLKVRNQQVSSKLAHHQQAFRVLNELCDKARSYSNLSAEEFDIGFVLNDLLALILHACNIDHGSLILIDEEAEQLEFVAVIGKSYGHLLNHRMSLQGGVVGQVIESGKALLIEDIHHSNRWSDSMDGRLGFHTRSLMCVPLNVDDSIIGAIEVANHVSELTFDESDLNVLRVASRLVSFALEKVEAVSISLENKA